ERASAMLRFHRGVTKTGASRSFVTWLIATECGAARVRGAHARPPRAAISGRLCEQFFEEPAVREQRHVGEEHLPVALEIRELLAEQERASVELADRSPPRRRGGDGAARAAGRGARARSARGSSAPAPWPPGPASRRERWPGSPRRTVGSASAP